MNRVKLQGRALTLRDQQRAAVSRSSNYGTVDFDSLRQTLDSRLFVGPPKPFWLRPEFQPDERTEGYWAFCSNFDRYGKSQVKQRGTPFVGDAFGYGQSTEV